MYMLPTFQLKGKCTSEVARIGSIVHLSKLRNHQYSPALSRGVRYLFEKFEELFVYKYETCCRSVECIRTDWAVASTAVRMFVYHARTWTKHDVTPFLTSQNDWRFLLHFFLFCSRSSTVTFHSYITEYFNDSWPFLTELILVRLEKIPQILNTLCTKTSAVNLLYLSIFCALQYIQLRLCLCYCPNPPQDKIPPLSVPLICLSCNHEFFTTSFPLLADLRGLCWWWFQARQAFQRLMNMAGLVLREMVRLHMSLHLC